MSNCHCSDYSPVAGSWSQTLLTILAVHGATERDACSWLARLHRLLNFPLPERLLSALREIPCAPATYPKVPRFLVVDSIRRLVWKKIGAETGPGKLFQNDVADPNDFDRRVLRMLVALGDESLANELRERPTQFWLAYCEGWAVVTSNVSAHLASVLDPSQQELAAAAMQCIESRPSYWCPNAKPRIVVEKDGSVVDLSPDYRFEVPDVVLDVGVYTEPYEIWLRPNIADDLGPLPISYNLIRPPMDVDVRGIGSLLVREFVRDRFP